MEADLVVRHDIVILFIKCEVEGFCNSVKLLVK